MEIPGYSIELEETIEKIKEENYNTIALQIPEGLKRYVLQIVEHLENKTNSNVIVIADPCFGACDLPNNALKNLKVQYVISIGHTPIPNIQKSSIPTVFINALSTKDISNVVTKATKYLVGKKIGIVTTAQHLHLLNKVIEILKRYTFKPIISAGDNRISAPGQILGCNFSSGLKIRHIIDSYLFLGSGNFHPLGLLLSTKKPVIVANPYENEVKKQELEDLKTTILRQRYGAIASSKNARKFGILVGIKQGQQRMDLANKIKETIDSFNKKSLIIAMDNFSSVSLQGFNNIDCLVSTACPRIAIDDYLQYKIPIITPIELEIVFNKRKWEDYIFDQIIG
jgi:2-(3-amino-3-carboxypropyl)histidine synthase